MEASAVKEAKVKIAFSSLNKINISCEHQIQTIFVNVLNGCCPLEKKLKTPCRLFSSSNDSGNFQNGGAHACGILSTADMSHTCLRHTKHRLLVKPTNNCLICQL